MSGYPRTEPCPCCEQRPVDVISPADLGVCPACHLALMDERTTTLAEAFRLEEAHILSVMEDPTTTDDVFADLVLERRR